MNEIIGLSESMDVLGSMLTSERDEKQRQALKCALAVLNDVIHNDVEKYGMYGTVLGGGQWARN